MSESKSTEGQADDLAKIKAAWLSLSGKIMAIVQNHALGLASCGLPLTDDDLALGNTREMQEGFENCMKMVTADYIQPLIVAHNEMAQVVNEI